MPRHRRPMSTCTCRPVRYAARSSCSKTRGSSSQWNELGTRCRLKNFSFGFSCLCRSVILGGIITWWLPDSPLRLARTVSSKDAAGCSGNSIVFFVVRAATRRRARQRRLRGTASAWASLSLPEGDLGHTHWFRSTWKARVSNEDAQPRLFPPPSRSPTIHAGEPSGARGKGHPEGRRHGRSPESLGGLVL